MTIKRHRILGQSTIEYVVLITIILGAFLAVGNYFKRGMQGRWKAAVDDLGDQYDPRVANGIVRQSLESSANTIIFATNSIDGLHTHRIDQSSSTEKKTGSTAIGAY